MNRNEVETVPSGAVVPKTTDEQLSLFSPEALGAIRKEEARWRREVLDPIAGRKAPWKKDFTTVSGMEVNPLSTPQDVAGLDFGRDIAYPGEFPYTRGIHPTGYRGKLWTMR